MRRRLLIATGLYVVCSLSLVIVPQRLGVAAAEHTGLVRSFYAQGGSEDPPVRGRAREIDLSFLENATNAPQRFFRVEWEGVWYLPVNALVDVDARADDRVRVTVDGELVVEHDITRNLETGPRRLLLSRGVPCSDGRLRAGRWWHFPACPMGPAGPGSQAANA